MEVEAVEFVAGLLGIHHVLIDHEGRAFSGVGDALAYLAILRGIVSNRIIAGSKFARAL